MTNEEADLIFAEQNKSKDEILKAIAKVKSDCQELCNLKNRRIAEFEKEKCELLGIIQGKDKAIKDLEWQLQEVAKDNDVYQAENKRLEKENADLKMALKWDADNRDELLKENARMRELLETLNESIVMTADDVFWSLKKDVEKFFEGEKYEEHQTEEM